MVRPPLARRLRSAPRLGSEPTGMTHLSPCGLLTAALLIASCGRPTPSQRSRGSDSLQSDAAHPAAPASASASDSASVSAPLRDVYHTAPLDTVD